MLGNLAWEPVLGNLAWESFLVTLLANLFLENLIGNLVLVVAEDPKLTLFGKSVPKQVPRKGSQASIQEEVLKQGPRNPFQARFQAGTRLAGTGSQASVPRKSWFQSKISWGNWDALLANLFLGTLLENLFLATLLEKLFLGTLLGILFQEILPGNFFRNLTCEPVSWETCVGCLGTLAWEPVPGNLAWNLLGTLPGFLFRNPAWQPLPGNPAWEPLAGTLAWESVPGNLAWEPLPGNLAWEPVPGNLAWEPLAGNSCLGTSWEP